MGKSIIQLDNTGNRSKLYSFLKNIAARILRHIRNNPVLWVSLAAFILLAWLLTNSVCVFRSIFGIPCPGCGLTRAVIAAVSGDLAAAFAAHPLFIPAAAALIIIIFIMVVNPGLLSSKPASIAWISLSVLFTGVYIYRMIKLFPLAEPMVFNHDAFVPRFFRLLKSLFIWFSQ